VVDEKTGATREAFLTADGLVIGRKAASYKEGPPDIALEDPDKLISQRHVRIDVKNGRILVKALHCNPVRLGPLPLDQHSAPESWDPREKLRIYHFVVTYARVDGGAAIPGGEEELEDDSTRADSCRSLQIEYSVAIHLRGDHRDLSIDPEVEKHIQLEVENLGEHYADIQLELEADAVLKPHLSLDRSLLQLSPVSRDNPRHRLPVTLRVKVPRTGIKAGTYKIVVKAENAPNAMRVLARELEISCEVKKVGDVRFGPLPVVNGWRGARLAVRLYNDSNRDAKLRLEPRVQQEVERCALTPPTIEVPAQDYRDIGLELRLPWRWAGGNGPVDVQILAFEDARQVTEVRGSFVQLPLLNKWLGGIVGTLLAILAGLIIRWVLAPSPPKIVDFRIEPDKVVALQGKTVSVIVNIERASSIKVDQGVGDMPPAGRASFPAPAESAVYTLVARGPGGETQAQFRLEVEPPTCQVSTASPAITLRQGPQPEYPSLFDQVEPGGSFRILARDVAGEWAHVRLQNDVQGWIPQRWAEWQCNVEWKKLPVEHVAPLVDRFEVVPSLLQRPGYVRVLWRVLSASRVEVDGRKVSANGWMGMRLTEARAFKLKAVGYQEDKVAEKEAKVEFQAGDPPPGGDGGGGGAPGGDPGARASLSPHPTGAAAHIAPRHWTHPLTLQRDLRVFHVLPERDGQVSVHVEWKSSGWLSSMVSKFVSIRPLTVLILDPVQAPPKHLVKTRKAEPPLDAHFDLLEKRAEALQQCFVVLESASNDVDAKLQIKYPSLGTDRLQFDGTVQFGGPRLSSTSVLALKAPGRVNAEIRWRSGPEQMQASLWAPGKDTYAARELSRSPLRISYDVGPGDLEAGSMWRLILEGDGAKELTGEVSVEIP
jgi:hypothetical protein